MTVKNFLKTAVLGIAFCSAFGMSNSIAMDNYYNQQQMNTQNKNVLRNIIKDLAIDSYFCGALSLPTSWGMDFIQKQGNKN